MVCKLSNSIHINIYQTYIIYLCNNFYAIILYYLTYCTSKYVINYKLKNCICAEIYGNDSYAMTNWPPKYIIHIYVILLNKMILYTTIKIKSQHILNLKYTVHYYLKSEYEE